MSDDTKSRLYLQSLFSAGQLPTENSFKLLIGSQLNSHDDLIVRRTLPSIGDTICVGAGNNGALLSFFDSLDNTSANWTLRLSPSTNNFEIRSGENASPALYLSSSGKAGVGTDQPEVEWDVTGDIKGNNLLIKDTIQTTDLQVTGTGVFDKLILRGIGEVSNLDSIKNEILATLKEELGYSNETGADTNGTNTHPEVDTGGEVTGGEDTGGEDTGTGDITGENGFIPLSFKTEPQVLPQKPTIADIDIETGELEPFATGSVAADGKWHDVVASLTGFSAYRFLATVGEQGNYAISLGNVVNINGDSSSSAINLTQSYMGSARSRIELQWKGNHTGYALQARTKRSFKTGTLIEYKLTNLL